MMPLMLSLPNAPPQVGAYVGFATVGAFVAWYLFGSFAGIDLSQDGHTTVTWHQLTHWQQCESWKGFKVGAGRAC